MSDTRECGSFAPTNVDTGTDYVCDLPFAHAGPCHWVNAMGNYGWWFPVLRQADRLPQAD